MEFAPEQHHLFDQVRDGRRVMAMAVGFPRNPEHWQANHVDPLFTLDWDGNSSLVTMPAVVELDNHHVDAVYEHEGPPMMRFPWLVGRTLTPTSGYYGPDVDIGSPESYRLWNLWPLQSWEAEEVLNGTRLWKEQNYDLLEAFYAADRGDADPCDIVIKDGPAYDEHQHREHLNSNGDCVLIECADGEEWLEAYKQGHFRLDDDGLLMPLPLAEPRLSDRLLQDLWEHLRDTSALNAFRAVTVFNEKQRPAILRTERHYSPWLWSS